VSPTQRRLLGESVREIGVLTLVFVPLDMLLQGRIDDSSSYPDWMFWMHWLRPQHWVEILFAAIGLALLYFGIRIEAKAHLEEGGNHI
jgi:succinate dehydrogenase/fumarate reductase cytochrome b subunit